MSEIDIEQERSNLEMERLGLARERLEFEQRKRGESLFVKNLGSIVIGIVSFFAFMVSATQAYIAWQQRRLAEAQTIERFIPHLLKPESRDLALTTMDSLVDRALVTVLAARFESGHTLEALAAQGSTEQKKAAQDALNELTRRRSLLISQMFDVNKDTRISATTTLSREWNADPKVITEALAYANAQRGNKSGIINTLALFQSFSPALLRAHYEDLTAFFETVKSNGPQTVDQINKIRALLERQTVTSESGNINTVS